MVNTFAYDHIPAIIEGWLPGIYGGEVLAKCVAGIINPGGKLSVDIPRSTGQTPVYYYQQNGSRSDSPMYGLNKHGYLMNLVVQYVHLDMENHIRVLHISVRI